MKVILSRKGFDSGYGGYPSPILPDGTMLSLPIPSNDSNIKYENLSYYDTKLKKRIKYSEVIRNLIGEKIKFEGNGSKNLDELYCHLDPDIREDCYCREPGWKGVFGQKDKAFIHLNNQKVEKGDLFLFFGWFRRTVYKEYKLKFDPECRGFHAIYGYLQIDKIEKIKDLKIEEYPEYKYHPHLCILNNLMDSDHLFFSTERLSFLKTKKGYGTFDLSEKNILTKKGYTRSKWELPEWIKNYEITYHSEKSRKADYFQSAYKGQEFVIKSDDKIIEGIKNLF